MEIRAIWLTLAWAFSVHAGDGLTRTQSDALRILGDKGQVRLIVEVHEGKSADHSIESAISQIGVSERTDVSRINRLTGVVRVRDKSSLMRLLNSKEVNHVIIDGSAASRSSGASDSRSAPFRFDVEGLTGDGSVVAILDSAFDANHPQLRGKIDLQGCFSVRDPDGASACPNGRVLRTDDVVDITSGSATDCTPRSDGCQHATHVASLIAGNRTEQASGVASSSHLVAIKVLDDQGVALWSSVLRGLNRVESIVEEYRATGRGHNIVAINMSFGTGRIYSGNCDEAPENRLVSNRIRSLREIGVGVIVAAGNSGAEGMGYPACSKYVIPVGALDEKGQLTDFTNRPAVGRMPIYALGTNVIAAVPGGNYSALTGTSMSAAIVSGSYAALKAKYPVATPDEIEQALHVSARRAGDPKSSRNYDAIDMISAQKALTAIIAARESHH